MKNIILTAFLMLMASSLLAGDVQETKEFADLKCKLTLPSPDFKWLDHRKVPNAKAILKNNSGTILLLLALKAPAGESINRNFTKGFDSGFCKGSKAAKISGDIITFKKVPCYQLQVRHKQTDSGGMIRVFFANGYAYNLEVIGNEALMKEKVKLEKLFSAFEFIGSPTMPRPVSSAVQKAYNYGYMMGRIAFYCIVIAVIVGIVALIKKVKNKNKKDS